MILHMENPKDLKKKKRKTLFKLINKFSNFMRYDESHVRREIYNCTHIHWKKRKISNDNLTVQLKDLEKQEQTKPKPDRKK